MVDRESFLHHASKRVETDEYHQCTGRGGEVGDSGDAERTDEEQQGGDDQQSVEAPVHQPVVTALREIEQSLDLRDAKGSQVRSVPKLPVKDVQTDDEDRASRISPRLSPTCTGIHSRSTASASREHPGEGVRGGTRTWMRHLESDDYKMTTHATQGFRRRTATPDSMRILFFLNNVSKTRHFDSVIDAARRARAHRSCSPRRGSGIDRSRCPRTCRSSTDGLIAQARAGPHRSDGMSRCAGSTGGGASRRRCGRRATTCGFFDARYAHAEKLEQRSAMHVPDGLARVRRRSRVARRVTGASLFAHAGDGRVASFRASRSSSSSSPTNARRRPGDAARRLRVVPDRLREERAPGGRAGCRSCPSAGTT